jgi:hypothetical protein
MPVAFSNSGRISCRTAAKPPDVMTLTCAMDADGKVRSAAVTNTDLWARERACS